MLEKYIVKVFTLCFMESYIFSVNLLCPHVWKKQHKLKVFFNIACNVSYHPTRFEMKNKLERGDTKNKSKG